jgi:hypothetical protein
MKNKIASMGANKIQWTNNITLDKDFISFCPKITISYEWIFDQNILQIVIKNAYSCPNTWHVFLFIIFE